MCRIIYANFRYFFSFYTQKEPWQLEIITAKTCRTHHRSCGRNEEARTRGTWSHATKIENIYRNDGGEASTHSAWSIRTWFEFGSFSPITQNIYIDIRFFCRAERGGSRGRAKLASLAVYNEDEANDFSDLGIGTSSASGKSSLSEDYDNNSVMVSTKQERNVWKIIKILKWYRT